MRQAQGTITVQTNGQNLYEITGDIAAWLEGQHVETGLLTLFCQHTSASLVIQENADPAVQQDLLEFFRNAAKEDPSLYRHKSEGPDDMPAHIRSALTDVQLTIPVAGKRMLLGTWQGVFPFEHRALPHDRHLVLHLSGE